MPAIHLSMDGVPGKGYASLPHLRTKEEMFPASGTWDPPETRGGWDLTLQGTWGCGSKRDGRWTLQDSLEPLSAWLLKSYPCSRLHALCCARSLPFPCCVAHFPAASCSASSGKTPQHCSSPSLTLQDSCLSPHSLTFRLERSVFRSQLCIT